MQCASHMYLLTYLLETRVQASFETLCFKHFLFHHATYASRPFYSYTAFFAYFTRDSLRWQAPVTQL